MATRVAIQATALADRYAAALYALAEDGGLIDAVMGDLRQLQEILAQSDDFARVIASPVLSRAAQSQGVLAVLDAVGIGEMTRRFVGVLAANRRLPWLAATISCYLDRVARARGEQLATVTSASALTEMQRTALTEALGRALGPKLAIDYDIDAGLIGGLTVQVRSKLIDCSISNQLRHLSLALNGAV